MTARGVGAGLLRLMPFARELHPPGGDPMWLRGRIAGGRYRVSVERRGQRFEVELSAHTEHGLEGEVALLSPLQRPLGPGLWLSLGEPPGRAPDGVALELRIETRSAAHDRGRALFGRLGGGLDLTRLLSPPRWSARLGFDGAGRPLRGTGDPGDAN